jgi:phenylacetate-CoA ligase
MAAGFFHLQRPPGNVWPGLPMGEGSQVWTAYLILDRTQWLDAAEVEDRQLDQVRALLDHCWHHVPYYQQAFNAAGIRPADIHTRADFRGIPILKREVYQERAVHLVARQLPTGTRQIGTITTSGTSGLPIAVHLTNMTSLWWLAFYLRDLEWAGLDPRGKLASIRTMTLKDPKQQEQLREGMTLPHWHGQLQRLIESGPSFGLDLHQDPRRQLAWLRQVQPDYLLSYPSNLDCLASLIRDDGQPVPGLKAIQSFAETLEDDARTRIESAFGVPVKDLYSCAEAGYLASPCPRGHGLHVHAENVILEVIDENDQPCSPGQTGRVVLTTLHNWLTPFVRYEILDDATPGPHPCPCGRGLPLLTRIDGKRRPMFHLADGRRKSSASLVNSMHRLGGIRQQQIVQRAVDQVVVRIVPARDWESSQIERINHLLKDFFEGPVRVEVQVVDRLELPRSGKLREVVNELEGDGGTGRSIPG